jgi:hypothetical protein
MSLSNRDAPAGSARTQRLGDRLSKELASSVVYVFGLYLVPYLVALAFDLPPRHLRPVFWAIHAAMLALALRRAWGARGRLSRRAVLFWGALLVLFLFPGVYLEFPADPWEHVRRIYAWGTAPTMTAHLQPFRLAYFWGWTLLGSVPIAKRPAALTLYAAFWNLVLAAQFYALARRLGLSRAWAMAQVVGTVFLFGLWAWSYYRYYALGSQALSFAVYLRVLVLGLDIAEGRPRRLPELAVAILLMLLNHPQELLLSLISAISLTAYAVSLRMGRGRVLAALGLVAAAGLAAGPWLLHFALRSAIAPVDLRPLMTSWGAFPLWDPDRAPGVLGLLGLHGVAGLAAAVWGLRRGGPIPFLTLTPAALLLFPPAATACALALGMRPELYVRVLFAFPPCFALLDGLRAALTAFCRRFGWTWLPRPALAIALLLPVALDPAPPLRGRLWFALQRPGPVLSLRPLDATAEWFQANRATAPVWRDGLLWVGGVDIDGTWQDYTARVGVRGRPCFLLTDGASGFALATQLGLPWMIDRRVYRDPSPLLPSRETLAAFLTRTPVCGFLVSEADAAVMAEESVVGRVVGHWIPDLVRQDLHPPAAYKTLLAALPEWGWTRTPVPPFYVLYEPTASTPDH